AQYASPRLRGAKAIAPYDALYPRGARAVVLLRVERQWRQLVAGRVVLIVDRRVAVDQRPQVHGMGDAAHLVLDREQRPVAVEVDDVAEAILIAVVLLAHQVTLAQLAVRAGKIHQIDRHVVIVELRLRAVGLAEQQLLIVPDHDAGSGALAVALDPGRHLDHAAIELGDAVRRADRHVELDVGNAEIERPKARRIGLMAAHAVAPRAGRLDVIVLFGKAEAGSLEPLAHGGEPLDE